MEGYLTTNEVALRLQRSVRQVQHLIAIGDLKAERIGRAYVVREATLSTFRLQRSGPKPKQLDLAPDTSI